MTETECKQYCYARRTEIYSIIQWILNQMGIRSLREARYPVAVACDPNIAHQLAWRYHKGQQDKAGIAYIQHPLTVASQFSDPALQCIALLHDVLEDTSATEKELIAQGIPAILVADVRGVTKKYYESYTDYIERVKKNKVCVYIKLADMMHNADVSRNTDFGLADCKRMDKYRKAIIQIAEMYGFRG